MLQSTLSQISPQLLPSHVYPHSCLKFGKKQASTAHFESQHVSEIAICEVESHISYHLLLRISGFSAEIPTSSLVEFQVLVFFVLFFFFFNCATLDCLLLFLEPAFSFPQNIVHSLVPPPLMPP